MALSVWSPAAICEAAGDLGIVDISYAGPALFSITSKTVSRVLYLAVIYLGGLLPDRSSHLLENSRASLMFSHGVAPDRVYSIGQSPADG